MAGLVASLELGAAPASAEPAATFSAPVAVEAEPVVEAVRGREPTVASDGSSWLVVYRSGDWSGGGWSGRILGSDGQPSSPPFGLGYSFAPPQVVFDGNDYVVLLDNGASYLRVSKDGKVLGEAEFLPLGSSFRRFTAAGGDSSVLAVVCDEHVPCQAWIIAQDGAATQGVTFAGQDNAVGYSDGTWLVLSIDGGAVTLRQLDETGALLDGTTKVLEGRDWGAVAPAAGGFAIAWGGDSMDHLALVDFAGAISVKTSLSLDTFAAQLGVTVDGYALRSGQDLQLLSSELTPLDGGYFSLPPSTGVLATNGLDRGLYVSEGSSSIEAELLSLAPTPSSLGTALVSLEPPTQRNPRSAPTDSGWLVAWEEHDARGRGSIRAVPLDEAGVPTSLPFLVTDDSATLATLSPGSQQRSLLTVVGPWSEEVSDTYLELFLVGANQRVVRHRHIGPLFMPEGSATLNVVASGAGWLVVWVGADGLHATRVDADGNQADDTLLSENAEASLPLAAASQGCSYRVFWGDWAAKTDQYRDIACSGRIKAATPTLFRSGDNLFSLHAAASDDAWWFLGTSTCNSKKCRPRGRQVWFGAEGGLSQTLSFNDASALVSVDGLALASVLDGKTMQFGLAEPGGDLQLLDSSIDSTWVDLSQPADNRVLVSFMELSAGSWGTPTLRVSTSVATVTGGPEVLTQGGGGAGGEGAGAASGDTAGGTSSSSAGGPSGGNADEPSDGSAGFGDESSSGRKASLSRSCGCRTVGGADPASGAAALMLFGAGALWRRRSRNS